MSVKALAGHILQYMESPPAHERIFRRHELLHLGDAGAVDQALTQLKQDHRAGSPAHDIWFPLQKWQDGQGIVQYIPPAYLKFLAQSLLRREGIVMTESVAERDYRLSWETSQEKGVWGVPTFAEIGVATPVALRLRWGKAEVRTEYQGQIMTSSQDHDLCSAFAILDAGGFVLEAERIGTDPVRLEKDLYVNRAIRALSRMQPPHGALVFEGGTALTKAWRLLSRFSEDIDCRLVLPDPASTYTPAIRRDVHAYARDYLTRHFLPGLPNGRLFRRGSKFRENAAVLPVILNYDSLLARESRVQTGIKVEIAFINHDVPILTRKVYNNPSPLNAREEILAEMPCVEPWVILAGKVAALTERIPRWEGVEDKLRQADFLRHLLDLYLCQIVYLSSDTVRRMRALLPQDTGLLQDRLTQTRMLLRREPFYRRAYRDYISRMFAGNAVTDRTFEGAVDNFAELGQRLLNPTDTDPGNEFRRAMR